jgi:hypothetical protein
MVGDGRLLLGEGSRMNERINELAEQAWAYQIRVYEDNGVRTYGEREKVFNKEKFAELIVRECIHQCKKDMVSDEDVVEGYDENWNMALKHGVEQIRKHFGVEL